MAAFLAEPMAAMFIVFHGIAGSNQISLSAITASRYVPRITFLNAETQMPGFKFVVVILMGMSMTTLAILGTPQPTSADDIASVADDNLSVVVYRLSDLPVYTADSDFSPWLISAFIETTVSPKTWEAAGGPSTMAPYPHNQSLVVSTTDKNHRAIQAALDQFRR